MQYDYIDGDKLDCCKCDRFVSEIDDNGLCPQCAEEERAAEFLACLGNRKTIEQFESEIDLTSSPRSPYP